MCGTRITLSIVGWESVSAASGQKIDGSGSRNCRFCCRAGRRLRQHPPRWPASVLPGFVWQGQGTSICMQGLWRRSGTPRATKHPDFPAAPNDFCSQTCNSEDRGSDSHRPNWDSCFGSAGTRTFCQGLGGRRPTRHFWNRFAKQDRQNAGLYF